MISVKRHIMIDGRPLLEPKGGGVFEYTSRLVHALRERGDHTYHIWANQYQRVGAEPLLRTDRMTRWPNKAMHAGIRFLEKPELDRFFQPSEASAAEGRDKPDLFWAPNPHFISLSPNMPFAITMHDLSYERYPEFFSSKRRLWHKAIDPRSLTERATAILAVSAHTKRDLVDLYRLPEEKIHITHEGCGEEFFKRAEEETLRDLRSRLGLPEHFILHVGTLEPRKNHLALVSAFELLKKNPRYGDLGLVLAGPCGWKNADILRAVRKSPASASIKLIGFVDAADKPALYQSALLFAFPSFYEGFGLPPLEAMASGTPVIASFASSLGEIVGNAGLLIDPYRPADLADALESTLESPSLRATLAHRGRIQAQKFTWADCAQKTAEVFAQIC